ncbi:MAG: LacI family DNA-binding transcriptional regulator [Candidatus Limivicinus sp.]
MVTIKMIAEACGLSIAAVSKALNHQPGISPEKAEWVRKTAQEMGYYPNAAARTLKTSHSKNIGIVFQNRLAHEFFSQVLESVRDYAEAKGYDITFLSSAGDSGMGYYDHAMRRQCDGVIIAQGFYDKNDVAKLSKSDIPVVSIDQIFQGRTAVVSDNVESMGAIVRYLYGLGHRRIAMIHGEDGDVTRMRLGGFYRACRECGIQVPDEYVIPARFQEPKDSGQATRKLLALKDRPTCILYPDDISYLGGLTEIERQGLSIPEDISCFGYDGIRLAGLLRPSLATYRQNAEEMGRRAADELISAIEDPKYYVPQIITVHGSVQPGGSVKDFSK